MASSSPLLLLPFLSILISTVSSQPAMSPLSQELSPSPGVSTIFHEGDLSFQEESTLYDSTSPPPQPPHVAETPLLAPELPPAPAPSPRMQEPLNSSREFTLDNTSISAPLPGVRDPPDFSQEFPLNNISAPPSAPLPAAGSPLLPPELPPALSPLPRMQELLNSSQEFSLKNISTSAPLPRIQEPLDFSQEFSQSNISTPPPPCAAEPPLLAPELPVTQEPVNSSQAFTLNKTSASAPFPRIQDSMNFSQEFSLHNISTPPPPPVGPPLAAKPPVLPPELPTTPPPIPRMQEPCNSSQAFTLNNISTSSPLPKNHKPLNSSQEFARQEISTAPSTPPLRPPCAAKPPVLPPGLPPTPPPLPRMKEPLTSQEFTLNITSESAPLPRIQDHLDFSQEFSLSNISTPSSLPRIQIPLNCSQEVARQDDSTPPSPPPRIQEPLNSSQAFTFNDTSTIPLLPFLYPSTIETTPPTPPLPRPEAMVSPLPFPNSSAITTTLLPTKTPLVPAFFILGDSSVDSGTNNFLGTLARADRPPYGRDFDTHQPTGRFCNGRIPVDFLALRLGLPFVPSYLGQNGTVEDMLQGVNYASAGAGIIFSSGLELGQRVSFTQQIQQFTDTLQTFIVNMGEDAATNFISKSVFYISVGINDYIHYYLRNASNVQNLYLPWSFNQFLAYTLKNEIKNLYDMSVRKVVVMGLPPIGCAPHYLWKYKSQNGKCIQEINDMIVEFNFIMRYIVEGLRGELPGANVIFCDMYEASMDIIENSAHYGFNVTADACCGWGRYRGWIMCISPEMACKNASNHIWWDQYHPTDAVNAILADNVWNGLHAKICYPMGLEEMVSDQNSK